jgi:hypothetical protein
MEHPSLPWGDYDELAARGPVIDERRETLHRPDSRERDT